MTRERVEPGIWRRGEVFEITWRDAQGKQRRKTVQGGCQVEVVDHERLVGTPDLVEVVEADRAVRIGQIDDSLQEALVFEDLPVEVVGLGPGQPLKHLLRAALFGGHAGRDRSRAWGRGGGLDLDGFLGGHLGPALDLRFVLHAEQHFEVRQDGADLVADRFDGRSAERPFPRSGEPAFPTLLRFAGATAASSSHSLRLLTNSIRTLISTSGYVCPLNGSRSTKALGRRSTLCSAMAFRGRLVLPEPRRPKMRRGRRLSATLRVP
jgi:hypothetical protein